MVEFIPLLFYTSKCVNSLFVIIYHDLQTIKGAIKVVLLPVKSLRYLVSVLLWTVNKWIHALNTSRKVLNALALLTLDLPLHRIPYVCSSVPL